jgi:hypothetical protein
MEWDFVAQADSDSLELTTFDFGGQDEVKRAGWF